VKVLAEKLQQLHQNANSNGEYYKIGELYGFRLIVKTDNSEGKEVHLDSNGKVMNTIFTQLKENRFFVEGEGNVKYTHNNGRMPADPKLAVNSFLHALEKIPTLIENHQKQNEKLQVDLPVLQEVVKSVWKKEDELKALKSELSALDRKIQLSLKPIDEGVDKPEKKLPQNDTQKAVMEIHDLMSGKTNSDSFIRTANNKTRFDEYKEAMGDRLVIATVPKYDNEKQARGIKI
jgi:hypothetical protein